MKSKIFENKINLSEYSSLFIDLSLNQAYTLVPFEEELDKTEVTIFHNYEFYNNDGTQITIKDIYGGPNKEFSNSVSTNIGIISDKTYINSVIGNCHLIYAKSVNSNSFWATHYDPEETRNGTNRYEDSTYPRKSYSDFNPKIPYSHKAANLAADDMIDVVVIVPQSKSYNENFPSASEFNKVIFTKNIGVSKINSLKIIAIQQKEKGECFYINFYPSTNELTIVDSKINPYMFSDQYINMCGITEDNLATIGNLIYNDTIFGLNIIGNTEYCTD